MSKTQRAGAGGKEVPGETRLLPRLNEFFELVVKVGLIVGGIGAVIQYLEAKQDKRVERVLAYAERFNQDPVLPAQQVLIAIFRDQARVAENLKASGISSAEAQEEERLFTEYLRSEANGGGVEREIDILVGFMDDVHNCFSEKLCDRKVTLSYFGPFAVQLADNLEPYIQDVRERRTPGYAAGLDALAEAQRRTRR